MTDSDVEMVIEDFERMTCTTEMDVVFSRFAESENEFDSWRYKVHTCFCRTEDCTPCAVRDCPHHDTCHYHHDGCPSCNPRPLWRGVRAGQVRREGPITIVELIWD